MKKKKKSVETYLVIIAFSFSYSLSLCQNSSTPCHILNIDHNILYSVLMRFVFVLFLLLLLALCFSKKKVNRKNYSVNQKTQECYLSFVFLFLSLLLLIAGTRVIIFMTFPYLHAHPAPLVRALSAIHMITTAILFDVDIAIWTGFCIDTEPKTSFTIGRAFLGPLNNLLTWGRWMSFVVARKAKSEAARALNDMATNHVCGNSISASRVRAPGNKRIIFDKGFGHKAQVFLIHWLLD